MADLPEVEEFTAGVFQIETDTPVLGGVDGPMNAAPRALANRTKWLRARIGDLASTAAGKGASLVALEQGGTVQDAVKWVTPEMFPSLEAAIAAAQGGALFLPAATYALNSGLDLSGVKSIYLDGDVVLDFTSITSAAEVPGRGYVTLDGGDLIALPALASNTTKGGTSLSFVSAPDVQAGDWICIYNPADYSYSAFNASYRDGQWAKVAGVSGTTVLLFTTILRDYVAADVDVYKHPGTTIDISGPGKLYIKESLVNDSALNQKAGFYAIRYVDVDFSKIRSRQADYGAMLLRQCINVSGSGYLTQQSTARSAGTNYGLVLTGCQNVNIDGSFYGYRHGVTVGGGNLVGDVPDRYVTIRGNFESHPTTTVGSANFHGHCEYIHFDGVFDGGVSGGGDYIKVSGVVRGRGNQAPVYLNGLRGANIDLSGLRIETQGNPQLNTAGCIDIGANAVNSLNADTVNGGIINLSGVKIIAPNSQRGFVIRNRGCTQPISMDISNFSSELGAGGINILDVISGSAFTSLNMTGAQINTGTWASVPGTGSGATSVIGWEVNGRINVTTNTGQAVMNTPIPTFQTPGSRSPIINVSWSGANATAGGKIVTSSARSLSATSGLVVTSTVDGANFASAEGIVVHYRITVT